MLEHDKPEDQEKIPGFFNIICTLLNSGVDINLNNERNKNADSSLKRILSRRELPLELHNNLETSLKSCQRQLQGIQPAGRPMPNVVEAFRGGEDEHQMLFVTRQQPRSVAAILRRPYSLKPGQEAILPRNDSGLMSPLRSFVPNAGMVLPQSQAVLPDPIPQPYAPSPAEPAQALTGDNVRTYQVTGHNPYGKGPNLWTVRVDGDKRTVTRGWA